MTRAAKKAGIHPSRVYQIMSEDAEFKAAVEEAMEAGVDRAENAAFKRAVDGVVKGIWHNGVKVGEELVYSDSMLALVLKSRRKAIYSERTELTGANGAPLVDGKEMDDTAKAARIAALMSLANARKAIEDLC